MYLIFSLTSAIVAALSEFPIIQGIEDPRNKKMMIWFFAKRILEAARVDAFGDPNPKTEEYLLQLTAQLYRKRISLDDVHDVTLREELKATGCSGESRYYSDGSDSSSDDEAMEAEVDYYYYGYSKFEEYPNEGIQYFNETEDKPQPRGRQRKGAGQRNEEREKKVKEVKMKENSPPTAYGITFQGKEDQSLTWSSEIDRMQNQVKLMMRGGGKVEYLVYLIFHTIVTRGWKEFALDVWKTPTVLGTSSGWGVHEDASNKNASASLSVSISLCPFLLDDDGRDQLRLALLSRSISLSPFLPPRQDVWDTQDLAGHFKITCLY